MVSTGVLADIGQRLLGDAVQDRLDLRGEIVGRPLDGEVGGDGVGRGVPL